MSQYIPKDWPCDNSHPFDQGDRAGAVKAVLFLIAIRQQAAPSHAIGCFKAREMACLWQQRMNGYV